MNYTLHQLKVFIMITEYQSVTKASEHLHLTQPAVSIQLKKLQDQFEIPLTEVIGRQLYVTDFGKKIAEVAKSILTEADLIASTVAQYKGILTGKIKISVVSTGKYVIPYFLQGFMEKYPGVEVNIDVSNKKAVVESLVANESDFSLVSVLPEDVPIKSIELMENQLFLLGSPRNKNTPKALADLKEVLLIFREEGSATRNIMEQFLKSNGLETTRYMEMVSNEAVKQAVNAGIGFSIMPLIGLTNELKLGTLRIIQMEGLPIITNWNLVYNQGKRLTPASLALESYVQEHKQQVIDTFFDKDLLFQDA